MNQWDYYSGSEKAFASPITVNDQTLQFALSGLKYNRQYKIVIPKDTILNTANRLEEDQVFTFYTEMKPLYIDPNEVQGLVLDLITWFELVDIMIAIKNAGVFVHSLLNLPFDPNQADYEELDEEDTNYETARQVVKYTTAIYLLQMAQQKMIANDGNSPNTSNASSIQLGDFMVTNSTSSKSQDILSYITDQLKFFYQTQKVWVDRLMNRTKRSYAAPIQGIFRRNVNAPTGRDFT